ncbi:hypothetical protein [Pedobacter sp. MC2016-24]|uniref:hypothetical protein n=1 Tax=Pedobacter sp. MC2016-24 TaxID=2780090 RepID=UPI00187FE00C|nr:hypothetical protein [Pedobacter sp. MC2016-24]MBE9603212.1 hypothetical protein [Pedobacter sp. MC2016-24]
MQVTLEIKGDKAFSILEVLKSMKGVKVKSVDQSKEEYLKLLSDAYKQTELAEEGKLKLKSFDDLIGEL